MATARAARREVEWPAGLQVCDPVDWVLPSDDFRDDVEHILQTWRRWCKAREHHLLSLGYLPDDAMHDSVGEFPVGTDRGLPPAQPVPLACLRLETCGRPG